MKKILSILACVVVLPINVMAHDSSSEKIYVEPHEVIISEEGIFVQLGNDVLFNIPGLYRDERGMFFQETCGKCFLCGQHYHDYHKDCPRCFR